MCINLSLFAQLNYPPTQTPNWINQNLPTHWHSLLTDTNKHWKAVSLVASGPHWEEWPPSIKCFDPRPIIPCLGYNYRHRSEFIPMCLICQSSSCVYASTSLSAACLHIIIPACVSVHFIKQWQPSSQQELNSDTCNRTITQKSAGINYM